MGRRSGLSTTVAAAAVARRGRRRATGRGVAHPGPPGRASTIAATRTAIPHWPSKPITCSHTKPRSDTTTRRPRCGALAAPTVSTPCRAFRRAAAAIRPVSGRTLANARRHLPRRRLHARSQARPGAPVRPRRPRWLNRGRRCAGRTRAAQTTGGPWADRGAHIPAPDRPTGRDTPVRDAAVALADVPGVGLGVEVITPGHLLRIDEAGRVRKQTESGSTGPFHHRLERGVAEVVPWSRRGGDGRTARGQRAFGGGPPAGGACAVSGPGHAAARTPPSSSPRPPLAPAPSAPAKRPGWSGRGAPAHPPTPGVHGGPYGDRH